VTARRYAVGYEQGELVIEDDSGDHPEGGTAYRCRCSCGARVILRSWDLQNGRRRCGYPQNHPQKKTPKPPPAAIAQARSRASYKTDRALTPVELSRLAAADPCAIAMRAGVSVRTIANARLGRRLRAFVVVAILSALSPDEEKGVTP
jgi:hypothetical protein